MMADTSTVPSILTTLVLPEIGDTLYMLVVATVLSLVLGIALACLMNLVKPGGSHPNAVAFAIIEVAIDLFISIPFIIMAVALVPVTTLIVGTSIGKNAAIVPLTIVTTPMFAKFIFDGMQEVNPWVIQAVVSFGASPIRVLRVTLKEALPAIVSGTTLSCITTLGNIAMAGAVGAGGIGAVAIIYGYQRCDYRVMWVVVILLIIITQALQIAGEQLHKRWR